MMIFAALTDIQIIFIVIASVVGAIVLFLLAFIPLSYIVHRNHYQNYYYRKIYGIALNHDYYLINNFVFKLDQYTNTKIDHILFGDKYIYVIMDKYYHGDLMGSASDPDLVLVGKNGDKSYEDNPYFGFPKLLSRFSTATGISTELMIGITLINNETRINIQTSSKQFFMVQRRRLAKLIKKIEAREVGKINGEQLQEAVLAVNSMNRKEKK